MLHLITFDTFEDKKSLIESEWLQRWFSKLINVNTRSVSLWRETWVNIYGVPLIAWGYDNFYNIGSMLGEYYLSTTKILIVQKFSFTQIVFCYKLQDII